VAASQVRWYPVLSDGYTLSRDSAVISTAKNNSTVLGIVDVSGDGRVDLVTSQRDGDQTCFYVRLSTNTGFGPDSAGRPWSCTNNPTFNAYLADVDGDGHVDLVLEVPGNGLRLYDVRLNTGTSFVRTGDVVSLPEQRIIGVLDVTGDVKCDLVSTPV
jgi:hypothetical protein